MSIATGTAVALGVGAATSIGGSAIAAHAQGKATDKAVAEQQSEADKTLGFQREVYGNTLANEQPYIAAGSDAVGALRSGLASGDLTAAYPGGAFHFTGVDLLNDPAYKFNLDQAQTAIQRSAAAQGGLVSGGTLKDLSDYTTGYAANQYQQSYANALAAYNQAYSQFENTQANKFNRLATVAGLGQNAVTQTATSGSNAAATTAATNANTANSLAGLYTGQGNATAGAIGAGTNAITGGVNSISNYLAQQQMLRQLTGSSYGGVTPPGVVQPGGWVGG